MQQDRFTGDDAPTPKLPPGCRRRCGVCGCVDFRKCRKQCPECGFIHGFGNAPFMVRRKEKRRAKEPG